MEFFILQVDFRSSISDSGIGMICNVFPGTLSRLLLALCPNITSSNLHSNLPFQKQSRVYICNMLWPCIKLLLTVLLFNSSQVEFNLPQLNCLFLNSWTVEWQYVIRALKIQPAMKVVILSCRRHLKINYTLYTKSSSLNIAGWKSSAYGAVLA